MSLSSCVCRSFFSELIPNSPSLNLSLHRPQLETRALSSEALCREQQEEIARLRGLLEALEAQDAHRWVPISKL